MTAVLAGARIALLEARRESELASLVRRHGGIPVCVPALREVERECSGEAALAIDSASRPGAIVVLSTGVGLERWLRLANAADRRIGLCDALSRATVVCRGPKPVAVLKREGLAAHVRAEPPHTTTELLSALATVDVRGRDVVVVHDGGGSRGVPEAMRAAGGRVVELQPYGWAMPEAPEPLNDLVRAIVAGSIDVLAVTTQVQAKHLFEAAASIGLDAALRASLRASTRVAAVGPTCARALEQLGAPAHIVPDQAKMGALILAIARQLELSRAAGS